MYHQNYNLGVAYFVALEVITRASTNGRIMTLHSASFPSNKQKQENSQNGNTPLDCGVDLLVSGVSALLMTGEISTRDDVLKNFPFFALLRKMASSQSSSTTFLNFRTNST